MLSKGRTAIGHSRPNACVAQNDLIGVDRFGDVFEFLLAHIPETDVELVLDVVEDGSGNANGARIGQLLESRRDIDAVAVNIIAIDNDVADIDPDPIGDLTIGRNF
jgi:hypothetical protein